MMYVDNSYTEVKREKILKREVSFISDAQRIATLQQIGADSQICGCDMQMVQDGTVQKLNIWEKKACIRQSACSVCTWIPFVSSRSSKNMSKCS